MIFWKIAQRSRSREPVLKTQPSVSGRVKTPKRFNTVVSVTAKNALPPATRVMTIAELSVVGTHAKTDSPRANGSEISANLIRARPRKGAKKRFKTIAAAMTANILRWNRSRSLPIPYPVTTKIVMIKMVLIEMPQAARLCSFVPGAESISPNTTAKTSPAGRNSFFILAASGLLE